jgi:hypothetical protein
MGMFNIYEEQAKQAASPQDTGMAYAKLSPGRGSVALAGQGGQMMAQGAMGAMGMKTPAQQRNEGIMAVRQQFPDPKTASEFMSMGNALNSIGESDMAKQAFEAAKGLDTKATDRKVLKGADGYNYFQDTHERVLPGVVKDPAKEEAPITAADRIIFNNFVEKSGKLKGAQDFADYKQSLKEKQAQAGTDFGSVKPEDITKMMGRWDTEVGSIEDSVATIDNARDLLDQAIAGNATAYEQVNRFLIKVVGDSQISNLEVQNMVKAGSLPERLSQTLTYWASGIPTQTKAEDIKAILGALNENSKMRINKKRARYRASYSSTPLPAKTIETIFGSDYDLGTSVNDATIDDIDAAIAAKSGVK